MKFQIAARIIWYVSDAFNLPICLEGIRITSKKNLRINFTQPLTNPDHLKLTARFRELNYSLVPERIRVSFKFTNDDYTLHIKLEPLNQS